MAEFQTANMVGKSLDSLEYEISKNHHEFVEIVDLVNEEDKELRKMVCKFHSAQIAS